MEQQSAHEDKCFTSPGEKIPQVGVVAEALGVWGCTCVLHFWRKLPGTTQVIEVIKQFLDDFVFILFSKPPEELVDAAHHRTMYLS